MVRSPAAPCRSTTGGPSPTTSKWMRTPLRSTNGIKSSPDPTLRERRSPLRRPLRWRDHKPLHVLGAAAIFSETEEPQVPVVVAVRVAGGAGGDCLLALDHQRFVPRLPRAGRVLLLEPVGNDGVAAPDQGFALVPRVVSVGGVLGEQGGYGRGIVGAPGVEVRVEPCLYVVMGHVGLLALMIFPDTD